MRAKLLLFTLTALAGLGQNANMVGLPEYGVILTGDIESPTPAIVDGSHKYLLAYVLRLTHANGGSLATPRLLTRNFRLNRPIISTPVPSNSIVAMVNGVVVSGPGAGPVVKAILESVVFDDGQFVGTDSRYFDNMSIQIDAERLLAQRVATQPPDIWTELSGLLEPSNFEAIRGKTTEEHLVFLAQRSLAQDLVQAKNKQGEAAAFEIANRSASLPVLWRSSK
jgi:hypothetical protein